LKNHLQKGLTGHILLATPQMQDELFEHAAVFICSHDEEGAVGIILNKPLESITFLELLAHLKMEAPKELHADKIHFGGPVEMNRGFVLHSTDYMHPTSLEIHEYIAITSNLDVFKTIHEGKGPKDMLIALGYAGWGKGQLEQEIQESSWIHVPATPDLIFKKDSKDKWESAIRSLGIDSNFLATETGRA
jgi:putative transcriptional regulator